MRASCDCYLPPISERTGCRLSHGGVSCWDCRRAGNGRHALSANHGTQHAATHRYMGRAAVDRLCTPQGGAASACTPIGSAPNGNRPNRWVIGAKQSRRLPMRRLMSAQGRVSRGRVYNAGTRRIAQIVEANPATIQAADLQQALATGLIQALMTSATTGYDVNVWDRMGYFYDTQAWIPKNVALVNRAAFDRLDKPMQDSVLKVAAAAEARGWWWSQEKSKWYTEQLAAHGMKVLPPGVALKTGLQEIGDRLTPPRGK